MESGIKSTKVFIEFLKHELYFERKRTFKERQTEEIIYRISQSQKLKDKKKWRTIMKKIFFLFVFSLTYVSLFAAENIFTSEEIVKMREENSIAYKVNFEGKYIGKRIIIVGEIADIAETGREMSKYGKYWIELSGMFLGDTAIICGFNNTEDLLSLKVSDNVKIEATYTETISKESDFLGSKITIYGIVFKNSKIIK